MRKVLDNIFANFKGLGLVISLANSLKRKFWQIGREVI